MQLFAYGMPKVPMPNAPTCFPASGISPFPTDLQDAVKGGSIIRFYMIVIYLKARTRLRHTSSKGVV
jgi:hypothetical protein